MNVNRILQVKNGNAVTAVQEFLAEWWKHYHLDALLAPVELTDHSGVASRVIHDPKKLSAVNPFAPVMLNNAASNFNQFVQRHRGERIAAILRPCELRALVELQKRGRLSSDLRSVVTIGVDCLGTFAPTEYAQRVKARGVEAVTCEALCYAADGGFTPQMFRTSCQACDWPAPRGADVVIGAIGIDPARYLLVIARDEATDSRLHLNAVINELAVEAQVERREIAVGDVVDMRAKRRESLLEAMPYTHDHHSDFVSALAWLANCSLCGDCLDACPLYDGELTGLLGVRGGTRQSRRAPLAELIDVSRWLAACAGCGMCEESCANHVPLTLLVMAMSHRIRHELHYTAGDPTQRLPWLSE